MTSGSNSMKFLDFPREIRDLVYLALIPSGQTYDIPSTSKSSLAQIIFFHTAPDLLWILFTSHAVQHEFLERLCAISTIRIPFCREGNLSEVISQEEANLMHHLDIVFDLTTYDYDINWKNGKEQTCKWRREQFFDGLRMFRGDEIKRRTCRFSLVEIVKNDLADLGTEFLDVLKYLKGFDTVVVALAPKGFKQSGSFHYESPVEIQWSYLRNEFLQPHVESILGPGLLSHEESAVCNEYHPRRFLSKGS